MLSEKERFNEFISWRRERKEKVKHYIDYVEAADKESRMLYSERKIIVRKSDFNNWEEPSFRRWEYRINFEF